MVNLRSYIALGLILTGAAYSADFFSPFIGPTEYRGQLGFTYVEGENPITSITFEVDASGAIGVECASIHAVLTTTEGITVQCEVVLE